MALEVQAAEQQAEQSQHDAFEATFRGALVHAELGATERSLARVEAAAASAASVAEPHRLPPTSTGTILSHSAEIISRPDDSTGPSGII